MEVALSSPQHGLCLRDVLDRLTVLRGTGMPDAYSWSSKRSYKSGYVWHDLTADDPVHPLKGSQLILLPQLPVRPRDASASSSSSSSICQGNDNKRMPPTAYRASARRKNWSSFDLGEYRVGAAVQMGAATQTDERRGGRRRNMPPAEQEAARTELGSDEISPPTSSSSPDTLETLIKHDARVSAVAAPQPAEAYTEKLISCGSIPEPAKREARRLPRGRSDLGALKRWSSYNADRAREMNMMSTGATAASCSKLEHAEEVVDGVRARCIPAARKPSSSKLPSSHIHVSGNQPEPSAALTEEK